MSSFFILKSREKYKLTEKSGQLTHSSDYLSWFYGRDAFKSTELLFSFMLSWPEAIFIFLILAAHVLNRFSNQFPLFFQSEHRKFIKFEVKKTSPLSNFLFLDSFWLIFDDLLDPFLINFQSVFGRFIITFVPSLTLLCLFCYFLVHFGLSHHFLVIFSHSFLFNYWSTEVF